MSSSTFSRGHMNSRISHKQEAVTVHPRYITDFYNKFGLDPALIPHEFLLKAEKTGFIDTTWMPTEFISKNEKCTLFSIFDTSFDPDWSTD